MFAQMVRLESAARMSMGDYALPTRSRAKPQRGSLALPLTAAVVGLSAVAAYFLF